MGTQRHLLGTEHNLLGTWLLGTELHLLGTQLLLLRTELKEYWSIGVVCPHHHCFPLHNPWLRVVLDVGGPAGKEKGGEGLLLVSRQGGDRAEEQGEGGAAQCGGQQPGEQRILVRNVGNFPSRISQS